MNVPINGNLECVFNSSIKDKLPFLLKSFIKLQNNENIFIVNRTNMVITLFHPNVIMHILHTVLYTFLKVLTRRICLLIKSFFFGDIISFILMTLICDSGRYTKEKLDASRS